jgi:predicted TPR repeat methyltransferase
MVFLIRNLIAIFVMLGQVSRALAPYVAQLVGVDISPRMVEVYNTRASTQGLEPHEMRAVSSLAELQQQRFDLAVVSHSLSS